MIQWEIDQLFPKPPSGFIFQFSYTDNYTCKQKSENESMLHMYTVVYTYTRVDHLYKWSTFKQPKIILKVLKPKGQEITSFITLKLKQEGNFFYCWFSPKFCCVDERWWNFITLFPVFCIFIAHTWNVRFIQLWNAKTVYVLKQTIYQEQIYTHVYFMLFFILSPSTNSYFSISQQCTLYNAPLLTDR